MEALKRAKAKGNGDVRAAGRSHLRFIPNVRRTDADCQNHGGRRMQLGSVLGLVIGPGIIRLKDFAKGGSLR